MPASRGPRLLPNRQLCVLGQGDQPVRIFEGGLAHGGQDDISREAGTIKKLNAELVLENVADIEPGRRSATVDRAIEALEGALLAAVEREFGPEARTQLAASFGARARRTR